jgi:hypothetical protein
MKEDPDQAWAKRGKGSKQKETGEGIGTHPAPFTAVRKCDL